MAPLVRRRVRCHRRCGSVGVCRYIGIGVGFLTFCGCLVSVIVVLRPLYDVGACRPEVAAASFVAAVGPGRCLLGRPAGDAVSFPLATMSLLTLGLDFLRPRGRAELGAIRAGERWGENRKKARARQERRRKASDARRAGGKRGWQNIRIP